MIKKLALLISLVSVFVIGLCVPSYAYWNGINEDDVLFSNNLLSAYNYDYSSHQNNYYNIIDTSRTNTSIVLDFGSNQFNGQISIGLGNDSDDVFNYDKYFTLTSNRQLVYFVYYNSIQGGYNDDDYNISEIRFRNTLGVYERINALVFNLFDVFYDNFDVRGYSAVDIGLDVNNTNQYYIGCYMYYSDSKVYIEQPFMCTYLMDTNYLYMPTGKYYTQNSIPVDVINSSSYKEGYDRGIEEQNGYIREVETINRNLQSANDSLRNQVSSLQEQLDNNFGWKNFAFAMVDLPFLSVQKMLGFEVFGLNMFLALTGIITVLCIIWIIKKLFK